ncbi:unnamed protein product, partial [Cochlearia groenlandica]
QRVIASREVPIEVHYESFGNYHEIYAHYLIEPQKRKKGVGLNRTKRYPPKKLLFLLFFRKKGRIWTKLMKWKKSE